MSPRTDPHTRLLVGALLTGLALAVVTQALPSSQNAGLLSTSLPKGDSKNGTVLCPRGWTLATAIGWDSEHAHKRLCVRVDRSERSWNAALQTCRTSKGFLIKLDTLLKLDNTLFADYLRQQDIDTIWTGMHHDHGTLLWDDLRPQMVKSYQGELQTLGVERRNWRLDATSFRKGDNTCGAFHVAEVEGAPDSVETFTDFMRRGKRSPLQLPGNGRLGLSRLFNRGGVGWEGDAATAAPLKDNEDMVPNGPGANREKNMESLKQFLSDQGFSEPYIDNLGENTAKPGTSKTENSNRASGPTTMSTTTTDQSNLEDDDYHVVTKRSLSKTTTTVPPETTTKSAGNQTAAPKFAPQKSVKGTSLPTYTDPQTTVAPETATTMDLLLHQLLEASIANNPEKKPTSVDGSGNYTGAPEIAFANEFPLSQNLGFPLPVDLQKSSESQSTGIDSNELLKLLMQQATATAVPTSNTNIDNSLATPKDDKTSTALPKDPLDINHVSASGFDPLSLLDAATNPPTSTSRAYTKQTTAPSKSTTTTADRMLVDSLNSVLGIEDSQSKDSKLSSELPFEIVTPQSITDIVRAVLGDILSTKSTTVTRLVFPTSTSRTTTTTDAEDSRENTESAASAELSTTTTASSLSTPTKSPSDAATTDTSQLTSTDKVESNQDSGEVDSSSLSEANLTDPLLLDSTGLDPTSTANDSAEVTPTALKDFVMHKDSPLTVDSPELFDSKPANDSGSSQEQQANHNTHSQPMRLSDEGSPESSNAAKEIINDQTDSIGLSIENNQDSLFQDSLEIPHDTSSNIPDTESSDEVHDSAPENNPDASLNTISLDSCNEDHSSVCATEAIEELSLVGHCDRNWYGHRLLDRCYKPLGFTLTEIEARQRCLRYSASLATADTDFYGNVTALLLDYFVQHRGFDKRVWVDTTLNLDIPVDQQCSALEDGQLHRVSCGTRLSFICQKDAYPFGNHFNDLHDKDDSVTFVRNMTSWHPQTLWCPLHMSASDDIILWFKDGRPIVDQDDDERTSFGLTNGQMPNRLDLELSILERIGEGGARIPKPAMLQGEYWCEIWRRQPFHTAVSHKIFLRFSDVITLNGHIMTEPADHVTAAMFNRMGYVSGLPGKLEYHLATMNKNITQFLHSVLPIVRDVITFIKHTSPVTGRSEFVTYICTATGDLTPHLRGNVADLYLSTFHEALLLNEDRLRQEWNLTLPLRQAVSVTMPDMCPETNLIDKKTGLSATFPSTPVNTLAFSRDYCNGGHTGSARCVGDLQTGAYWEDWHITGRCYHSDRQDSSSSEEEEEEDDYTKDEDFDDDDDSKSDENIKKDGGRVITKLPNSALLELDEIEIESDNVADVTERLANVLDTSDDLSDEDIETVVQVVDRIVSVQKPPIEVSDKLIKTVNRVLEAPVENIRKAEKRSKASSRLIKDLEIFGEKVDMGVDPRVRRVTPNVAMELWNLEDASDVVIGFGATQTPSWSAPLSDPRIITIKDRAWAEKHLPEFDIAITLPESLVKNTVRYSDTSLRLSMFIYRKPGLFLPAEGESSEQVLPGTVNSAIISASLGGRKIRGLEDRVKLLFKPFKEARDYKDGTVHCAFWDTESEGRARWSDAGCVYNGTLNGRDVCLCDHLTNFAILLDYYGDEDPISPEHETSLSILTLIGISLSIIGLAITIITFLAFKKLRQGRAQQTLFNMAIALLCFQTTFLVGVKQTSITPVCLTVAVLLHYFILVSFAWMLIEAVLQYLTFVKVLGTYISRYTLKTVLPAWGFPLLPVIAVLATDYHLYLGRTNYCWMDLNAFYYAFALPVGIIILFNFIMFFVIIISLVTRPKGLRSNQANNKTRETNLKAAFTIFVLLGLTWLFGYLAIEDARLPFQYAFTILSSMQGFLIFILMVARRKQVRDQWEIMCCRRGKGKQRKQKKLSPMSSHSTSSSNNSMSNSRTLPSFINHGYNGDSTMVLSGSVLQRQTSISV